MTNSFASNGTNLGQGCGCKTPLGKQNVMVEGGGVVI